MFRLARKIAIYMYICNVQCMHVLVHLPHVHIIKFVCIAYNIILCQYDGRRGSQRQHLQPKPEGVDGHLYPVQRLWTCLQ